MGYGGCRLTSPRLTLEINQLSAQRPRAQSGEEYHVINGIVHIRRGCRTDTGHAQPQTGNEAHCCCRCASLLLVSRLLCHHHWRQWLANSLCFWCPGSPSPMYRCPEYGVVYACVCHDDKNNVAHLSLRFCAAPAVSWFWKKAVGCLDYRVVWGNSDMLTGSRGWVFNLPTRWHIVVQQWVKADKQWLKMVVTIIATWQRFPQAHPPLSLSQVQRGWYLAYAAQYSDRGPSKH